MTTAIIGVSGKQYKVTPGAKFKTERQEGAVGDALHFDKVLLLIEDGSVRVGTPYVEGARVEGKILRHGRGEKVIVFKYHSKTRYKKKKGHRQPYTEVEITKIT